MHSVKHIDIIIPARNEQEFIEHCLRSVLQFELSAGVELVIYVVDGRSEDRTREIVCGLAQQHPNIQLLDNPGKLQSCGLNLAIQAGNGDYILRLDAHATYPPNYLSLCLSTMERTGADNVGGVIITQPGGRTYGATLVQALTTHGIGVGNAS